MQAFLRFGNATTSCHEDTIQEVRMSIMKFTTYLSQSASEESTECLFLSSSNITEDTDIFGENIFTSTEDRYRILVRRWETRGIRRDIISCHLFKLRKNAADLKAF